MDGKVAGSFLFQLGYCFLLKNDAKYISPNYKQLSMLPVRKESNAILKEKECEGKNQEANFC